MRRSGVFAVLGLLVCSLVAVSAPSALANNDPHRVFLPAGPPFTLPVGFCSFRLHFEVVANKEYGKFTTLPDGTVILKETGKLKVRATNVRTGKSVLLSISGPGTITFDADGSVTVDGTGRWLTFNLATDTAPFGLPAVMLSSGHLHETMDPTGALTVLSVTGRVTDVCAALG